jgi:fatty acid desaturase
MQDDLFSSIRRQELVDASGVAYAEFRSGLVPSWRRVWRDIAAGWAALAAINLLLALAAGRVLAVDVLLVICGAIANGYFIAYLHLFLHEAAHFNLHPSRTANDWLCNVFVSGVAGVDVRDYRPIHWEHHRNLGTPMDAEISYFDPLNVRFLLESATGVRVLKVFLVRRKSARNAGSKETSRTRRTFPYVLLGGMLFNAVYLAVLYLLGSWTLMLAWCGGVLVFFPFFTAIRQLLEHRSFDAKKKIDYRLVEHGAIHRLFGDGPLASTLGGAGFNRHLLHHWDPGLSYTRLGDLERYLMNTESAAYLKERQTSYWQAFRRLLRASSV